MHLFIRERIEKLVLLYCKGIKRRRKTIELKRPKMIRNLAFLLVSPFSMFCTLASPPSLPPSPSLLLLLISP